MSCRVVDCCRRNTDESGYATPAALITGIAIAMAASAMVVRSAQLVRQSRGDLERTRIEYALSGAQLLAAATVVRTDQPGPFHWTSSTDLGWDDVIAEPEADKLSLAAGAALPAEVFGTFGVSDVGALQAKLSAAAVNSGTPVDVGAMDAAPLWKVCGARLISPFGQQDAYVFAPDVQPTVGASAQWRTNKVWRIRVSTAAGWRDDRIVRFTGDANHPAATVARWLSRGEGDGGRCEALLKALGGGAGTPATP